MGLFCSTTVLDINMVGINFDTATTNLAVRMIDNAENEIKKYLSRRYDLSSSTFNTTTSIPPLVRTWCEDLAEGYMWKRMSRGSKESMTRGNDLIKPVIENLKEVSNYHLSLFDSTGSIIDDFSNTAYQVRCNTDDYTETFLEDNPLNWAVDTDKLDDIDSDRD